MDREIVVHLHNEVLLSRKKTKQWNLEICRKMDGTRRNHSELTQSQKDKHDIYSYVYFRHRVKDYQPTVHTAREMNKQGGS